MIRPTSAVVSTQPLTSEVGKLARSLVFASEVPAEMVDKVASDLTAFPEPWLKRFDKDNAALVILKDNQTLADTPYMNTFTPEQCTAMIQKARPLVAEVVQGVMGDIDKIQDPDERAYAQYGASEDLRVKLEELSNKGLGFSVEVSREPKNISYLAAEHGVDVDDPADVGRFAQAFQDLNEGYVQFDGDHATPQKGFMLLPYVEYKHKPVRALTLPSYQAITGMDAQLHDGMHFAENRLIVLHDSSVPEPNNISGRHRVDLHECGHLLDWICRELPETKETHEKRVNELYSKAMADPSLLLTKRGGDTAEEFMAEAVEAYLTVPVGDAADRHKAENNRIELQKRNPELYGYIDHLINL